MKRHGFTLLEMMVSIAVLSAVSVLLLVLSTNLAQSSQIQGAKVTTTDEARSAMLFLAKELRQSAAQSMGAAVLPGTTLTYQIATDADGNGSAVDVGCDLELSATRTLSRDFEDANSDGLTLTQLIMTEDLPAGPRVRVIANGLLLNEDTNGNATLDTGEDANANGRLDRGLWFERTGRSIRVTVQTQRNASAQGLPITSGLVETVFPRN
jgi:prepilin-type N-terminal cleavage/methylation domain-containing protein